MVAQRLGSSRPTRVGLPSPRPRRASETVYLTAELARSVLENTNNIDHCAPALTQRHRWSSGHHARLWRDDQLDCRAGRRQSAFSSSAPIATEQHPLIGRANHAGEEKGATLILADPRHDHVGSSRRPCTCATGQGRTSALLNGLMNVIIAEGLEAKISSRKRTEGFRMRSRPPSRATLPEHVEKLTGVPKQSIVRAAGRAYARAEARSLVLIRWASPQHTTGVDNVKSCATRPADGQLSAGGAPVSIRCGVR